MFGPKLLNERPNLNIKDNSLKKLQTSEPPYNSQIPEMKLFRTFNYLIPEEQKSNKNNPKSECIY